MRNTSRRVRVGVLIATGIIGFGGVAAAGPGGVFDNGEASDEVATTTTTTSEVPGSTTTVAATTTTVAATTTTTAAPETTSTTALPIVEEVPVPLVDDPETTFDETMCLEGNHGKTVSAVARGELVIPDIDVVDAAHSSCGKDAAEEEASADEVEPADAEDDAGQGPAKEKKDHNKGNGQANGRGRGNPNDD